MCFTIILLLFFGKLLGENQEIRLFSDNIRKNVYIYEPLCQVIQSQDTIRDTSKYFTTITIHSH